MIYLAAPFFTPTQLERIQILERRLDEIGIPYFSPRKEGGVLNDMSPSERSKALSQVFHSNVSGMHRATLLLAGVDDKDTGTTWEMGFFYGYHFCVSSGQFTNTGNLPKVALMTYSFDGKPANVMLTQSALNHFTDLESMIERLAACWELVDPAERGLGMLDWVWANESLSVLEQQSTSE